MIGADMGHLSARCLGVNMGRPRKEADIPGEFSQGWLAKLDGRTIIAQEMQARFAEVCKDLGGIEALSYMQRSLVERALWLEFWLGQQERDLASGSADFDVGRWVQAANGLQGIYGKLGLQRRARDVTDLAAYMKGKAYA